MENTFGFFQFSIRRRQIRILYGTFFRAKWPQKMMILRASINVLNAALGPNQAKTMIVFLWYRVKGPQKISIIRALINVLNAGLGPNQAKTMIIFFWYRGKGGGGLDLGTDI